ncbi:MAG: arginine--tRNA ligase [Ruminococcaceae bacterium]|nr:arginine--tRNA ligase [Oscillospiraceae bacterium]
MLNFKKKLAVSISEKILSAFSVEVSADEIGEMFEFPPEPHMGDVAFPSFKLSRTLRRSPQQIAEAIADGLAVEGAERVEVVSGYVNIFISSEYTVTSMLGNMLALGDDFGRLTEGEGKTMCIDYSSPNMAKRFHIGHLGTTAIGNSIKRIHEFSGYKCVGINHLGDWGTQYGRLAVAYSRWGSREEVERLGVKELERIYQKFYIEAEKDPSLNDEARAAFTKMENGDEELLAIWRWFKEISLKEFMKTYDLLGVSFESYDGESFYNDKMDAVVKEIDEKGILVESEGAKIVPLEDYKMPPCIILKSDGSTIYATRDITAALYRKKTYNFDKCIYVTDAGQSLHFAQFFKVIGLMGYDWEDQLVHVPYGKVSIGGQKLATRAGNAVLLEDLFGEAIKRVRAVIEEKNPDCEDKDEIARKVGVGAVIFNQLSAGRIKDINFIWEEALNFDGNTGPYVQYTYVRACSVLEKTPMPEVEMATEIGEDEKEMIKTLSLFPIRVRQALCEYEPSVISRYMLDVCHAFNRFYHNCPIIKADDSTKALRLSICRGVKSVLGNALWLIGMEKTERI